MKVVSKLLLVFTSLFFTHGIAIAASQQDLNFLYAIRDSDEVRVFEMLSQGANPNATSEGGTPALVLALTKGNMNIINKLIDTGAEVNRPQYPQGVTPLMIVSSYSSDYEGIFDKMIRAGADVNQRANGDVTALMQATGKGNYSVVQKLINAGAEVNVKNDRGYSALYVARAKGYTDIVKILRDAGATD